MCFAHPHVLTVVATPYIRFRQVVRKAHLQVDILQLSTMLWVQIVKKLFLLLSNFEREASSLLQFYESNALQRYGNVNT